MLSFPRMLDATRPATVRVNLLFEGQVVAAVDGSPCLVAEDEEARLGHAVLLGALVEADEVAVLELEREGTEPGWLGVTLLSVPGGERLRAAGLQLETGREPSLEALAEWVATGAASVPLAPAPRASRPRAAAPAKAQALAVPPPRRKALPVVLAGVGAGLAAAGVGLQLAADASARTGAPSALQQGLAWTSLGLGAASLAGAAVLWIVPAADEGTPAFAVGVGASSLSVAGQF